MKKLAFVGLFIGLMFVAAESVSAQEYSIPRCRNGADIVSIWSDADFRGYCINYSEGAYPQISTETNDRVYAALRDNTASSFQVGANVKAVFCTEPNFMGHCELVERNGSNMVGVGQIKDDQLSSVLVVKRSVPNDQITQAIQQHRQQVQGQASQPQNQSAAGNECTKQVGNTPVNLDILNSTGKPFVINWVDSNCKENASNQPVPPNQRFRGQTYAGHAFRIREAGTNRLLQTVVADPRRASIVVNPTAGNNTATQQTRPTNPPTNTAPPPPSTGLPAAAGKFPITGGKSLKVGEKYFSSSGRHYVTLQSDGNFMVVDKDGKYLWGLDRLNKNQADRIEFTGDGSLVAYDKAGRNIWSPQTGRDPNAKLELTYDGALQLIAGNGDILWSNDGVLAKTFKIFITPPPIKPCTPDPGWSKCIEINGPSIKINGTAAASWSAMNGVANVYSEMTKRFTAAAPKDKYNGFKVYLTNGEDWPVLAKIEPVGSMWPDQRGGKSGNFLRGGASGGTFVWISEQMICKTGVKTRNAQGTPDNEPRTLDQVVHEFAHTMDHNYVSDQAANSFVRFAGPNQDSVEGFAWGVQAWFGSPGRPINANQENILKGIFSSRAIFSCEGYKP